MPIHAGRAPMSPRRFRRLVAAYGANPARWPEPERAAAEELIAASAEAQMALAEAKALDGELTRAPVPVGPATLDRLRDGIRHRVARLPAASQVAPEPWLAGVFAMPLRLGALAAAALVGVWLGWSEPLLSNPDPLAALQLYPIADEVL